MARGVPLVTGRSADRTVDDAVRAAAADEARKAKNDEGETDE
jgi:hypothetical protein